MDKTPSAEFSAFERYRKTIDALFGENGCPWDKEQTPLSLRTCLAEETYECIEAINEEDAAHVKEELGDVFSVAMMIALVFELRGAFSIDDVINGVNEKLIRRHPHVFGDVQVKDSSEVLENWVKIKRTVEGRAEKPHTLDDVSRALPPLERAFKLQKKAAQKGFDWDAAGGVLAKIREELAETEAEIAKSEAYVDMSDTALEGELGDLLFSVVNLCRFLNIDPSLALTRTNAKFTKRFAYVADKCAEKNISMKGENAASMETFWQEAKGE